MSSPTPSRTKVTVKTEPLASPSASSPPSSATAGPPSADYAASLKSRYAQLAAKKSRTAAAAAPAPAPSPPSPSPSPAPSVPSPSAAILNTLPLISLLPPTRRPPPTAPRPSPPPPSPSPVRLIAPSPYDPSPDTVRRKKRPAPPPSNPLIRIGPPLPPPPTPPAALPIPRTASSVVSSPSPSSAPPRPPPSRATVDLSDTSHLTAPPGSSLSLPLPSSSPSLSSPSPSTQSTLHVSNLPPSTLSSHLHPLFSPFGLITSIVVPPLPPLTTPSASLPSPYAFVHYASPAAAAAALASPHPFRLSSHSLQVAYAKPKGGVSGGGVGVGGVGGVGGLERRHTYAELEMELAGGGQEGEGEEDGFDWQLLAVRRTLALAAGVTEETAVRRRRGRAEGLGRALAEAAADYPVPSTDALPEPDREAISYDDLALPYT